MVAAYTLVLAAGAVLPRAHLAARYSLRFMSATGGTPRALRGEAWTAS